MAVRLRSLARWGGVLAGIGSVWLAVERWLWFQKLPRYANARMCGNCFLGSVGLAFELALLGSLVASACLLRVRPRREDIVWWAHAILGLLGTPYLIGVPLFVGSFLMLAAPIAQAVFRRAE